MRAIPLLVIAAIVFGACEAPEMVARKAPAPHQSSPAGCTPGKPARVWMSKTIGTTKIASRCPESKALPIGAGRKLVLGAVLAQLPCRWWADFAGSWWQVVKPYPKHLAHIGHSYLPGTMTLVSEDRAVFTAEAIDLYLGKRDEPTRFPAKGDLELSFERVGGPVHQGGCD